MENEKKKAKLKIKVTADLILKCVWYLILVVYAVFMRKTWQFPD